MAIEINKGKPGEGMTLRAQGNTPGPWRLKRSTAKNTMYEVVSTATASQAIYDVAKIVRPIHGVAEAEANAHLIAAAPELLEALTKTVQAYDDAGNWVQDMDMAWIDDARTAIAKATGQ